MAILTSPQELIERNATYTKTHTPSQHFPAGGFPVKPKRMVIISCLDHRVHPEELLGLDAGSRIPIIRNAGGRARNAVFEAAALDTIIEVTDLIVIHHTNCGLTITNDENISKGLSERSSVELAKYDLNNFCFTDVPQSVREDIAFLREHPFVRKETNVTGFVYDIDTGKIEQVEA